MDQNLDIDVDEIVVQPCCRAVSKEGVELIKQSIKENGVSSANRISVHILSSAEYSAFNEAAASHQGAAGVPKRFRIIDGAHRVTALRELISLNKTEVRSLNALVYKDVPSNLLSMAASILNETTETLVKTTAIDRLFFISQLLSSSALPRECFNLQKNIIKVQVVKWLQKNGYTASRNTQTVMSFVQWAGNDLLNHIMLRHTECELLHNFFSDTAMKTFQAKFKSSELRLQKSFIDRIVAFIRRKTSPNAGPVEKFDNIDDLITKMCDRTHKAWKEIDMFAMHICELTGSEKAPSIDQFTPQEQLYCDNLLTGSDLSFDLLIRDSCSPTGQIGQFSLFLDMRSAELAATRRSVAFPQLIENELSDQDLDSDVRGGGEDFSCSETKGERTDERISPTLSREEEDDSWRGVLNDSPELQGDSFTAFDAALEIDLQPQLANAGLNEESQLEEDLGRPNASQTVSRRRGGRRRTTPDEPVLQFGDFISPEIGTLRKGRGRALGAPSQKRSAKRLKANPVSIATEQNLEDIIVQGQDTKEDLSIDDMRKAVHFLGGTFPNIHDSNAFDGNLAQLIVVQAHGLDATTLVTYLVSAADVLARDGTCVILCLSEEYATVRTLVKSQRNLIAEPEPLVVVLDKDAYGRMDKRGGTGIHMISATFFAVITHKSLEQFEYTYQRNMAIPLDARQKIPGRANVILDYFPPPIDERISIRMPHELHVEFFRLLVHRYSLPLHCVIGMPMGTGNVAVGALWEQRRFYGVDPLPANVEEAISRCYLMYNKHKGSFGINKHIVVNVDWLPSTMPDSSDHLPVYFRTHAEEDELDDAKIDANTYNLHIKSSAIPGELGLFAKKGLKEGDLIGYYWGRFFFDRQSSTSNRVISTQKKRLYGDQGFKPMYIDGSRRCAVTYVNDPKGTNLVVNMTFIEYDFDTRKPMSGELTSPPLWMIMRGVAKMDIPVDTEIFASYANNYFEDGAAQRCSSPAPSSSTPEEDTSDSNQVTIPFEPLPALSAVEVTEINVRSEEEATD